MIVKEQVEQFLTFLGNKRIAVFSLNDSGKPDTGGIKDSIAEAVDLICQLDQVKTCYVSLNEPRADVPNDKIGFARTEVGKVNNLFIDIEHPEKDREVDKSTLESAMSIMDKWLIEHKFKAMMNFSGRGFHVIIKADLPISNGEDIKRLYETINPLLPGGLHCDTKVSRSETLIGIPGTMNRKHKEPKLRKILKTYDGSILTKTDLASFFPWKPTTLSWENLPNKDNRNKDRIFWAILYKHYPAFATDNNSLKKLVQDAGWTTIEASNGHGVFVRSKNESSFTTPPTAKDILINGGLQIFALHSHDWFLEGGDAKSFIQTYLPNIWKEVEDAIKSEEKSSSSDKKEEDGLIDSDALSLRELLSMYHEELKPPLIWGLLRFEELLNIVGGTKTRKTWLALELAIRIATGSLWMGKFQCEKGKVLILDNELHKETLGFRLATIAKSIGGINLDDVWDNITVKSLRGSNYDIHRIREYVKKFPKKSFKLIILDSLYKTYPEGTNENDNGSMAIIYNVLDAIAAESGAAIAIVHHTTKGSQANKGVTDIGSGAGVISRATDTHLTLRKHNKENVIAVESRNRSFIDPNPFCIQWSFPLYLPSDANPNDIQTKNTQGKTMSAEDFAGVYLWTNKPQRKDNVLAKAFANGMQKETAKMLWSLAEGEDLIKEMLGEDKKTKYYVLNDNPLLVKTL